ncbi:unnamed protein product [Ranitomeya imitator]|uniref:LanC-like protein 2 n=1 Tax=Ranitomeya imitator TaxID=111125 RepID=A0ABN9KT08_9NEOB|nr:unnamed protein product [Ranitomeya imitator]
MQDNARPDVAGVCQQFLQDESIEAMDWPARSPDLNLIEHIWDIMFHTIHQCHVAPQTVQELADALVQVWEEIPQETIRRLIWSMPRRCREVIQITGRFSRRIQSKISDLLQQMEEGLKTTDPHDCSTYTGYTGIALLYLQLYRVTKDQAHLLRSLDYVKRILRNLNGRRVTFLCGDAGPLAVGAVVHHKLQNEVESKDCITKLLALHRGVVSTDPELPDELLYGRAGYLYALLYLNAEIGPDTVPQATVKELVDAIIESGKNLSKDEHKTERCPLLYQWHKKQYVGAAHGLAGIYYILMQAVRTRKKVVHVNSPIE